MVDVQQLCATYQSDTRLTIPKLAKQFGIRAADAAALLRLQQVTIRRGRADSLTDDARAKGLEVRRDKALQRAVTKLIDKYGAKQILRAMEEAGGSGAE